MATIPFRKAYPAYHFEGGLVIVTGSSGYFKFGDPVYAPYEDPAAGGVGPIYGTGTFAPVAVVSDDLVDPLATGPGIETLARGDDDELDLEDFDISNMPFRPIPGGSSFPLPSRPVLHIGDWD